ncbi:uncharacterized protein LOC124118310 [Haliotis rufescens]|uniref:uncharacterized protein LOC124118310 n=1 Tax=Haliotis rufescens TaxID=6454 RepID=UPI00201F4B0D|nr:uncharacterized protein LOC124118310 [Haliotis rufescens]XP_046336383.2 uncharacterized protein LOC124118310 [Haliotis rufescens]XP_048250332.1 uncharacterized protein LOC124118310 [Haliotis rufescens]XP_048250333.1 uncharacterized protein LOC124118310 [Haliotis rufescens]
MRMKQGKIMMVLGTCLGTLLIYTTVSYTGLSTRPSILAPQPSRLRDNTHGDIIVSVQKNKDSTVLQSGSKSPKQEAYIINGNKTTLNNRNSERIRQMLQKAAYNAPEIHIRRSEASLREDALESTFPPRKPYQSGFQQVDARIFIFSAIYEIANSSVRTLILVPEPFKPVSFFCILKRSWAHLGHRIKGRFQHIPPSRWGNYKNRCGFVHCPVPPNSYPEFISVLTARMSSPLNVLPVNYPGPPYNRLTRCYPAVHGNFTDVNTLVTALETSRYFGTDKFLFYNYSIPEDVNKVLLHYEREGIVEMRNWKLPFPPDQIHYWGQMASIHDCVFSQLGVAKYVLLADIDEIIVPKKNVSIADLADRLLNTRKPTSQQNVYGALMFQNAFFALYENETKYMFTEKKDAKKFKMNAFLHTNRSRINGPNYRSKLLVKPEAVNLIHVHIMEEFLPGWEMYVVSPEVALMHHYREKKDSQSLNPWSQDFTYIKYSSSLIPKIKDRLISLQSELGIQI